MKFITYHPLISRKPLVPLAVSINRWYRNCSLAFISAEESMLPISLDVCNTTPHHFSTHQHHYCSPTSTIIALLTITIVPTITITAPPTSLTIAEVHYLVSSSTDTSQGKVYKPAYSNISHTGYNPVRLVNSLIGSVNNTIWSIGCIE